MLLAAGNANAGESGDCGGKLVEYKPIMAGNAKVGQVQLYYNAQNGNNCAVNAHGAANWNQRAETYVVLLHCYRPYREDPTCHYARVIDEDHGFYKFQAGPVRGKGEDKCVVAFAWTVYNGKEYQTQTSRHCG